MAIRRMLIDASQNDEVRMALVRDSELLDFDFENISQKPTKGNIYLGKIIRVEPSLQAAFVEYGGNRHGFLPFTEIHPDYFQIPVADRTALIAEEGEKGEEDLVEDLDPQEEESSEESFPEPSEEDETIAEEDEELRRKFSLYRNYKIQEVIKSRQIVLVQVLKEERGNKGAALTTFVSLAGRYSVLMPNALNAGGVSRKITDAENRKRLRQLMKDLGVPEGMSLIVRTAGLDRNKEEIKRDYSYLLELWQKIRERTMSAIAPSLVYEEPDLLKRVIRDIYGADIDEILVEGPDAWKEARDFMEVLMPGQVDKVKLYESSDVSLFQKYNVQSQIDEIYMPTAYLRSGGYIVINSTEALVAIDVNSGKATKERHIENTALKTNLEAAEEIARQLRIRDLGGLIVIDFIDMSQYRHNAAVEKRLKEALSLDRARIQVGRISQFGLLEMSRQRLRPSIMESSSVKCPYCTGVGMVRSKESLTLQLFRTLEELSSAQIKDKPLVVKLSAEMSVHLLAAKKQELSDLEARKGVFFRLQQDDSLKALGFRIEDAAGNFIVDSIGKKPEPCEKGPKESRPKNKNQKSKKRGNQKESQPSLEVLEDVLPQSLEVGERKEGEEVMADFFPSQQKKRSQGKRRFRQRKKFSGNRPEGEGQSMSSESIPPQAFEGASTQESSPQQGKKRGWWQKLLD